MMPQIRGYDKWGSGAYLASRGNRLHSGIDIIQQPGTIVEAIVSGDVIRVGLPYAAPKKQWYRLIEFRHDPVTTFKIMYVHPFVKAGDHVRLGDPIGISQNLDVVYPGITPHYHFEVHIEGVRINPLDWLADLYERTGRGYGFSG